MFQGGMHFLFHQWHSSCQSCQQSGDKSLNEEEKKGQHCHGHDTKKNYSSQVLDCDNLNIFNA